MKNATKKMVFNLSKLNTLNFYKNEVENLKSYVDLLNKRKFLIKVDFETKSDFEKNEIEINILKTDWDLGKAHKNLSEREKQFVEISNLTSEYIKEINEKFDALYEKAINYDSHADTKAQIELEFSRVEGKDLDKDYDAKISLYINLKTFIEGKRPKANLPKNKNLKVVK